MEDRIATMLCYFEQAGYEVEWCDTAVPCYENTVQAGVPTDVSDITQGDYVMVPKSLVNSSSLFCVRVKGDSMVDCGIYEGDMLHVQITEGLSGIREGDTVVACVDGGMTVKTFFRDEQGEVWLLPRNEKYQPLRLTEGMAVHICGKVVEVTRDMPYAPTTEMLRIMERAKANSCAATTTTLGCALMPPAPSLHLPLPSPSAPQRERTTGRKKEHLFSKRNGEKNEALTSEKVAAFKAHLASLELLDEPINCSRKAPFNIALTACYKAWEKEKLVPSMPNGRAIYRFLAEDCGFCLPGIKTYAEFIRKMIA